MKLKEIAIASGIVLAYGAIQSVFATPHPIGGAEADVTGVSDAASTLWAIGNYAALPLGVIGAVWKGVGGGSDGQRGFDYGKAAGGFVGGGVLAYSPVIVTSFLEAAGAAGADFSAPGAVSYFSGGLFGDHTMLFIGILFMLAYRLIKGHSDVGSVRNRG